MTNHQNNSILSVFQGFEKDVNSLFPELDLTESWKILYMTIADPDNGLRKLCRLGKSFEQSLITGKPMVFDHSDFKPHLESKLPEMFFELFLEVVPSTDGVNPSALTHFDDANKGYKALIVLVLRQILLGFSKLEDIPCDADSEVELTQFASRITAIPEIKLGSDVISLSRWLLRQFFYDDLEDEEPCADLTQWVNDPFGRHGPGAVAEGEEGFRKWEFDYSPRTDASIYASIPLPGFELPVSEFTIPGSARACVVPKDFRKHRIICIEPKEHMFAQQGLMQVLYDRLRRHPLTRRSIRLQNQDWQGRQSAHYLMGTVDLSDASDYLSKSLCRLLLPRDVFVMLSRYRSSSIDLGASVIPKYETMFTMGNALCFPTETLIFWALSLATLMLADKAEFEFSSIARQQVTPLSFTHALLRARDVRVYGDDIVVPYIHVEDLTCNLARAGLVVNTSKTCVNTLVRESCGHWYYNGYDCRITRFSYHKAVDARTWVSLIENSVALHRSGFSAAAVCVAGLCEEIHPVAYGFGGLPGLRSIKGDWIRYNAELCRLEIRRPVLAAMQDRTVRLDGLRGYYAYWTKQAVSAMIPSQAQCLNWIWVDAMTGEV